MCVSLFIHHQSSQSWQSTHDLPYAVQEHSCVAHRDGTFAVITGGENRDHTFSHILLMRGDLTTEIIGEMKYARYWHISEIITGNLFIRGKVHKF